jgi:hypothetical protein
MSLTNSAAIQHKKDSESEEKSKEKAPAMA